MSFAVTSFAMMSFAAFVTSERQEASSP